MRRDNENDLLSFVSIAALTANVIRHLGLNEKKDDNDEQREADKTSHDYIQKRIAELMRFEQVANGVLPHRPRRKRE